MAVWSSVKLSDLYGPYRLDAECYTPRMLRDEKAIAHVSTVKLSDIAFVTDGQHGYHEVDESSPVRHITAKCIDAGLVIDNGVDRLAMETHHNNPASSLEVDDVLLSTVGRIGQVGIVADDVLPANIDQDLVRLKVNPDSPVHPYYLSTFLRSEFGQFQCERGTTGQIQGHINLTALRLFDIPVLPSDDVVEFVRQGLKQHRRSQTTIAAAESRLMEALGLDELDLSSSKTYARSLNDMEAEARFDAEYFNPKFQRLIEKLREDGRTLGDVANLAQRKFDPGETHKGNAFDYIEIGSLTGDGETESEALPINKAPSRATWIVKPGDVLTSLVRPIRRLSALIRDEQEDYVCSSGFAVLEPTGIKPELLLCYLRLPLICELLDLNTTASMYPAIPTDRLMRIPIKLPDAKTTRYVVDKVNASIAARREAAALLEQAKRRVEELIESGK